MYIWVLLCCLSACVAPLFEFKGLSFKRLEDRDAASILLYGTDVLMPNAATNASEDVLIEVVL